MNLRHLMKTARFVALLFVALGLSSGCGSNRRDALVAKLVNLSDRKVALGQRVFMAQCNQCHPYGAAGLGPALNNKRLLTPFVEFQVRHGLGAMPKFPRSKISDSELDAVIRFLHAQRDADSMPA